MNAVAIFENPIIHQPGERYGHAAPPGTGPLGETCGTCAHICRRDIGSRSFYKCSIIESKWTHGKKTDILKTDESCSMWEDVTHA